MIFTNASAAKELNIVFREATPQDAAEVLACIQSEYGDHYFAQSLYDLNYMASEIRSGSLMVQLADLNDGSAAAIINTWYFKHLDNIAAFGGLIVRPDCRRFGISGPFMEYAFDIAKNTGAAALYSYPYASHTITQVPAMKLGFVACGFEFQRADSGIMSYSFGGGHNAKSICGLCVMPHRAKAPARVFVPDDLKPITEKIYGAVGMRPDISHEGEPDTDMFHFAVSEHNRYCSAYVESGGEALGAAVLGAAGAYRHWPTLTINAYVNINRKSAVPSITALQKAGFFFAGLFPVTGDGAVVMLHHPMNTQIYFDEIKTTGFFTDLLSDIREHYEKRAIKA